MKLSSTPGWYVPDRASILNQRLLREKQEAARIKSVNLENMVEVLKSQMQQLMQQAGLK